jgi:hypothetical protein
MHKINDVLLRRVGVAILKDKELIHTILLKLGELDKQANWPCQVFADDQILLPSDLFTGQSGTKDMSPSHSHFRVDPVNPFWPFPADDLLLTLCAEPWTWNWSYSTNVWLVTGIVGAQPWAMLLSSVPAKGCAPRLTPLDGCSHPRHCVSAYVRQL